MRVYRWKKPTVNITKGSSGTLTAGTYYVWGYRCIPLATYVSYYSATSTSPRPDVQTVVLGTGETSITASLSDTGAITTISDAGSGKIKITSSLHCLTSGDSITISGTTNYDGTYTITDWVDYNNFKVTATYVSDQTGTWTNTKRVSNGATYLIVYISTSYPFDSSGNYIYVAGQNHMYITNSADSITITSLSSTYGGYTTWAADCDALSVDSKYIIDYGVPYFYGTESSTTDSTLMTEITNSGLSNIAEIRSITYNAFYTKLWHLGININFPNLIMTVNNAMVKIVGLCYLPNVTFTNSFIDKIGISYKDNYNYSIYGYFNFKIDNCIVESTRAAGFTNVITPSNTNNSRGGLIMSNITYQNGASGATYNGHDNIGLNRTIENLTIVNGQIALGCTYHNIPAFNNLTFINSPANYDWVNYPQAGTNFNWGYGININTNRTDNEFIIKQTYYFSSEYNFYCYRQKTIYIYDVNGDPIEDATITITQGSNTYTCTTDSNGKGVTDLMKEQDSIWVNNQYFNSNTIYYDWTIKIEKNGYETYTSESYIARDIEEEITLKPIVPTRQTIEGKLLLANQAELGSSSKLLEL